MALRNFRTQKMKTSSAYRSIALVITNLNIYGFMDLQPNMIVLWAFKVKATAGVFTKVTQCITPIINEFLAHSFERL